MKPLKSVNYILSAENLNAQVKEIHESRLSYDEKRRALIEVGLMPQDLKIIYNGRYFNPKAPLRVYTKRGEVLTFGVEIECFVNPYAMRDAAEANDVKIAYESYNHVDGKSYYKFVSDASVRNDNGRGIECVSPVLKGAAGMKSLKAVCKALNDANATVNKSCGLHVHVGAKTLTNEQRANVFKNYAILEQTISMALAPSRRNNGYCKGIATKMAQLNNCHSIDDVQSVLRDRYYTVNPMAFIRHQTIEFRQHQGTTNFEKISMWVNFCTKLVAWSKDNVLTGRTEIENIPFLNAKEKAYFKARAIQFAQSI